MSKPISKGLLMVLTIVAGVFMAPSPMFFGSVQATESIADFSDDPDTNTISYTSSSMMQSSSSNKGSITHVQAKKKHYTIHL